jgi:hypothetical protein
MKRPKYLQPWDEELGVEIRETSGGKIASRKFIRGVDLCKPESKERSDE